MKTLATFIFALWLCLNLNGEPRTLLRCSHPQEIAELELLPSGTAIKYTITSPLVNTIYDPKIPLFQITYGTWRLESDEILVVELKHSQPNRFTQDGEGYTHGEKTWARVKELIFDQKLAELKSGRLPNQDERIDHPWKPKK